MNANVERPQGARWRGPLLVIAALRGALGIAAIPLAPFLFDEHFVVVVLLRPTKEVLLAAGFLVREGDVALAPVVVAALPLLLGGVWLFFGLGRAYHDEIERAELPGLAGRLLPAERIASMSEVLRKRGGKLVLLGRIAAFPSSVLAAAAGSSGMSAGRFLPADGLGAAFSVVEVIGVGYLLGETYDEAGPWITGAGVVVLIAMLVLFGRYLKRAERSVPGGDIHGELRGVLADRERFGSIEGLPVAGETDRTV